MSCANSLLTYESLAEFAPEDDFHFFGTSTIVENIDFSEIKAYYFIQLTVFNVG